MSAKVLVDGDILIVKLDNEVKLFADYTITNILLNFMDREQAKLPIGKAFKDVEKETVIKGCKTVHEELKSFMPEHGIQSVMRSYNRVDLSDAQVIKEF